MVIVTVHEAKAQLSKLIARALAGEEVVIAPAQLEDAVLVSNEKLFDSYGVRRLW